MTTCSKHPRYHAVQKPRTSCIECWRVFLQQDPAALSPREVLAIIDRRLSVLDHGANELWDVLTALRAEDDSTQASKYETTTKLRGIAFPLTAAVGGAYHRLACIDAIPESERDETLSRLEQYDNSGFHFRSHLRTGAHALRSLLGLAK